MYGPDLYSSDEDEDEFLADDPEYEVYKQKEKQIRLNALPENVEVKDPLLEIFHDICLGRIDEVIKLLHEGNHAIDVELKDGWTPLLLACSMGKVDLVKELINKGANINSTKDSLTSLMLACDCPKETAPFEDSLEIIMYLVEKGIDVDVVDRKRKTSLMFAAYNGHLEAIKFLLPLCNRNAEDNQRWTALFWAVYGNHVHVVKYLLDEGFSVERQDIRELTPYEMAKEFGLEDVVKLFPDNLSRRSLTLLDEFRPDFTCMFLNLRSDVMPQFFPDVCNLLYGTRNQNLIPFFKEKDMNLKTFLEFSDSDLQSQGIMLPYQRNRILTGLFRFHQQNFLPKSIPAVQKDDLYSNIDVCHALVSAIKQMIAVEAALGFIRKNSESIVVKQEEINNILQSLRQVKKRIRSLKAVAMKLTKNAECWDKQIKPADLILPTSKRRKIPWRKIIFSLGLVSLVLMRISIKGTW